MKTLRFFSAGLLLSLGLAEAEAIDRNVNSDILNLTNLTLRIDEHAGKMNIGISMNVKPFSVSSEREMIFTPMLIAADCRDSIALEPVIIAGRNRWFHYLRDGVSVRDCNIYRAGTEGTVKYEDVIDMEPWMRNSFLEMRCQTANCCDPAERLNGSSPNGNIPLAKIFPEEDFDAPFIFAPPVDAGPVTKALKGSAFITFVVNRTELKPDYMKNRAEINKITNTIEQVRHDPDARITKVNIKGFASPEGAYKNNMRLAAGRTETLRRYVRDLYSFPDSVVTSAFESEDWDGLRRYVADSMQFDIKHRPEILALIDTPIDPDERNNRIKNLYPADYKVMLKEIYPWLRHSDYAVNFSIKIYTSLDEIRSAYAADPTRLRNVDFFTLAQSYPEGSQDFDRVMLKAVEVYPDDALLNLNCANIAMKNGNLSQAQEYMLKAGFSPEALYANGILAARRRDYKDAVRYFEQAQKAGLSGADKALERAKALADGTLRVEYLAK